MPEDGAKVRLDLNNPVFQEGLFGLQKADRQAALETLNKLRRLTWDQVYRDAGLKWEKIASVEPPPGIAALYSLRITRSRRATAYREGAFIRLLSIAPDHDSTYGKR
ncbi:hypothetical protein [Thiohalocapsa sp. ML1]|jgi:hypothetical protein|uniref:hypothetical protein n=1 Tax=Thiohalocapsa sp. ML1 TaxID=1431688 RepID=UPI0007322CA5|nr:hypothetical protein [Thiohalocapsa sp. ML1]